MTPSDSQVATRRGSFERCQISHRARWARGRAAMMPGDALVAIFRAGSVFPSPPRSWGRGVFPDDHANALGALGFMRHDYVNFGFDRADVIVRVGYDLQGILFP